ncbi:ubiquitin-like Rad60 SUMO-like protein [Medicago truncatula]|uniref:Ubiquitin-like Rad60 SUMO-like protein n=2 Tax=Medicago truncatula TaxID=3880 RepID=G7KFT0_MEDTR|nr:ubiquitin-like Rad60 SUMO-like protein [Medicago truncatula]
MYGNKMFPLIVKSSDTILDVKKKIHDKEGIPVHQQRLFFDGKPIKDRQTLANYNIPENSTIDTRSIAKRSRPLFNLGFRGLAD